MCRHDVTYSSRIPDYVTFEVTQQNTVCPFVMYDGHESPFEHVEYYSVFVH